MNLISRASRFGIVVTAGLAMTACAEPHAAPFNETISKAALIRDVAVIANDSTRGRLVGTPEHARVADWIGERFASLGLEPAGDSGTYAQNFGLMWFSLGDGNALTVSGAGEELRPGEGWYPLNFSATTAASGDVVFAGFGIVEPQLQYDSYRGADVAGKIVLVLEREPGVADSASPFDGVVTSESSREWRKALAAQQHGAAGILFVRDIQNRPDNRDWAAAAARAWPQERRRIETFSLPEWMSSITLPGAVISTTLADALLSGSGTTLRELAQAAEASQNGLGVRPLPGAHVSLRTAVERHTIPAVNVMGLVRGTDPELQDEAVIVMAHYDMNGADSANIFGGADDNASGSAGLLAIAAAYAGAAEQDIRPRRSVLFVASDAEERGPSLGAWYYTQHPVFPLEKTVAVFNMDMIGRNEEVPENGGRRFSGLAPQTAESNSNALNILGYSRTPQLAAAVAAANKHTDLTLRFRYDNNESNLLRRSDHWPFLQNGVPALFIHTGLHPDYHTRSDVPEQLNYEKMTRIVRLIHQASWNLASADGRPVVEKMGPRPRS